MKKKDNKKEYIIMEESSDLPEDFWEKENEKYSDNKDIKRIVEEFKEKWERFCFSSNEASYDEDFGKELDNILTSLKEKVRKEERERTKERIIELVDKNTTEIAEGRHIIEYRDFVNLIQDL